MGFLCIPYWLHWSSEMRAKTYDYDRFAESAASVVCSCRDHQTVSLGGDQEEDSGYFIQSHTYLT